MIRREEPRYILQRNTVLQRLSFNVSSMSSARSIKRYLIAMGSVGMGSVGSSFGWVLPGSQTAAVPGSLCLSQDYFDNTPLHKAACRDKAWPKAGRITEILLAAKVPYVFLFVRQLKPFSGKPPPSQRGQTDCTSHCRRIWEGHGS